MKIQKKIKKVRTEKFIKFFISKRKNLSLTNSFGHIHCATLYDTFKFWFKNNNPNSKIPSNKEFINNLKKYKNVCKVKIDDKSQLGIKNLQIIN
jgi:hypothetical protein